MKAQLATIKVLLQPGYENVLELRKAINSCLAVIDWGYWPNGGAIKNIEIRDDFPADVRAAKSAETSDPEFFDEMEAEFYRIAQGRARMADALEAMGRLPGIVEQLRLEARRYRDCAEVFRGPNNGSMP